MNPTPAIKTLFASEVSRRIEEVIKVDQTDKQIISEEIAEYVATDSIKRHYIEVLERYWDTPNHPHEGIAVWVSGFFGSGKSSFAKLLGLSLENQEVLGTGAADRFAQRVGDTRLQVLLKNITEHVPTTSVIFDVSTDRGIRTGNQTITEIMYRLFLRRLGYARDLDLAELEITLESDGQLDQFKQAYRSIFDKDWDREKEKVAFALAEASQVMHRLDPKRFPATDTWLQAARDRADITPGLLAERCKRLMDRRRPKQSLVFVVDEVGQFVARDVQKMLDLQAVVQNLGRVGRGRMWVTVTSQEKLTELVSGIGDRRVELARLMDRFPLQVHLEPSDISEVTSKRVLSKNAEGQRLLRELFEQDRARLTDNTRLTADINLPPLTAESFINLYPLLPYQIDLIIQVVSGLRTQGGATTHVGGANRTIIKIAQQLLINPATNTGEQPLGRLARLDQIYDLVSGNISSEIRGKIDHIKTAVAHPLAQPVAKAICLLQYVKSVHRTAENFAAALHPATDADSQLPQIKEALDALVKAMLVRKGDDGYRIPTPAEDDWERQRAAFSPQPADESRILAECVKELWSPQPAHSLLNIKLFRGSLLFNTRLLEEGDVPFHVTLATEGKDYAEQCTEMRARSQTEIKSVFWIGTLNKAIDDKLVEVHRSKEILSKKERSATTAAENALVAEEKKRMRDHSVDLRALLTRALLSGTIYFRGNDRSPDETMVEVGRAAEAVLAKALPEVFERFHEGAAKVRPQDLIVLLTTENLRGLTSVFTDLQLVHEHAGKTIFSTEGGPLAEVAAQIQHRTTYGESATRRYLTEYFVKEPFGWDFDVIRLFVGCLLRAGLIEATSQGQNIDSATSLEAKNTFTNNNLFRAASFRPKQSGLTFAEWAEAAEAFKDVFGREVPEIEQGVVATCIREAINKAEASVQAAHTLLVTNNLPGVAVLHECLELMRGMRTGSDEQTIIAFRGSHKKLKEGSRRASELNAALTEPQLVDCRRARRALTELWPFLQAEESLSDQVRQSAAELADLMGRETFFKDLPSIEQRTRVLEQDYEARYQQAVTTRTGAYGAALEQLRAHPSWPQLTQPQQGQVSAPLEACATAETKATIPLLRADTDACPSRLQRAIAEMMRFVDGNRLVSVSAASFFKGGVETEEQLDAALDGLRETCMEQIAAGKKVMIQW
jgi:hypothetical protein